jgi:hypothetical protein
MSRRISPAYRKSHTCWQRCGTFTSGVAASPHQQSVPIVSLAKVMTAYLTLKRYPLSGAQDGFTITITAAQAQAEARDVAENQSDVAVAAGEQLTERQLLEALVIPSGNNIAPRSSWSTPSPPRPAGQQSRLSAFVPPTRTATRGYSLPSPRARIDVNANDHPEENV